MSQSSQPQAVRSYLSELESALAGVPEDVARDILDGVAEELAGLDSAAAATRIEELGDPAFIAAEARAESARPSAGEASAGAPAGDPQSSSGRGSVVAISLAVAFGGVVVPVVGWIVGLVFMWFSKRWRTWEKWVATIAVPGVALVVGAIGAAISGSLFSGFGMSGFAGWHLLILLGVLGAGNVVAGLWLLWRGLRRPTDAMPGRAASATAARGAATTSGDAQWYIVLASLLVAFGGIILPLLGWVFGIAMVWVSKTWRTWEKWTATLLAPGVALAAVLIPRWIVSGLGTVNAEGDGVPNVPVIYVFDTWWSGIILLTLMNVIVGLWLLWRGLHRR